MSEQVRVMRYPGSYRSQADERFALDAAEAVQHGWSPTSSHWDGHELVVTYAFGSPAASDRWAPPPGAAPDPLRHGLITPFVTEPSQSATIDPRGIGYAAGGVAVAISAFLPWVSSPLASRSGLDDGRDGIFLIGVGLGLIVLGVGLATDARWRRGAYRTAFMFGLVALALVAVEWYSVAESISWHRTIKTLGAEFISTGYAFAIGALGAVLALATSASIWRSQRRQRRREANAMAPGVA
jgi:hypothetical protein